MKHLRNSLLILVTTLVSFQVSAQAAAGGSILSAPLPACNAKLSAAQCTTLRSQLTIWTNAVLAKFGNTSIVQKVIAAANTEVNKLCPVPVTPPYNNQYSADSQYECTVLDSTGVNQISMGVDTNGILSNVTPTYKVACVSQTACTSLISQKFQVLATAQTARCSSATDQTVLHLTDAQVLSDINLIP